MFASVVAEIKHLLRLRKTCITHINRSQNEVTHHSAILLDFDGGPVVWLGSGPPNAVDLCIAECNLENV